MLTFLDLGDATSRNLAFSHRDDVWVSYGEETITETNLLEIRRRHPETVHVQTFPKRVEAQIGADWEWHIIGQRRTLMMRVQAKRVQCNDVLKIAHEVRSSGKQQRDLLMKDADAAGMKAVYCIYCTELQRNVWKECDALPGYAPDGFESVSVSVSLPSSWASSSTGTETVFSVSPAAKLSVPFVAV